MNRTLLFVFVALTLASGCKKEPEVIKGQPKPEEPIVVESALPYIYAEILETKAGLAADNKAIAWAVGDVLTVTGIKEVKKEEETSQETVKAETETDPEEDLTGKAKYSILSEADAAEGKFTYVEGYSLTEVTECNVYPEGWVNFAEQSFYPGKFPLFMTSEVKGPDRLVFSHTYGYVKLPIKGDATIQKITVMADGIAGTAKNTITVDVKEPVKLSDTPTDFYFVVPERTSALNVKIVIYSEEDAMPVLYEGKRYEANKIDVLNPVTYEPSLSLYPGSKEVAVTVKQMVGKEQKSVTWAPVNCGYSEDHPNGLHYQWGRLTGFPYYPAKSAELSILGYSVADGPVEVPDDNVFYKIDGDWRTPSLESSWPSDPADFGYLEGKLANPCPKGWRIPTYDELNGLCTGNFVSHTGSWGVPTSSDPVKAEKLVVNPGGYFAGLGIAEEDKTTSVFFALTGQRTGATGGSYYRAADGWGRFWSSETVTGTSSKAHLFNVKATEKNEETGLRSVFPEMTETAKAVGASVRCVKE